MLRKMVRSVSRGRERPPSPEFNSKDAKQHDARYRAESGDRASGVRDTTRARPGSPAGSTQVVPFYLDTGLEALSLEPLIRPTLERMRPTLAHAERLLPPLPDLPAHSRRGSLTVPKQAYVPPLMAIERDTVVLKTYAPPDIVVTPPAPDKSSSSKSSQSSEHNPFELEFGSAPDLPITPLPKRPPLQRKAVSYRTQRELPLRVQAVRRSHQEMYARQILAQSPLTRQGAIRRASETAVPQRPRPQPLQSADTNRSRSLANVHAPEPRSRSASRSGSRARHERLPSGPHRARAHEAEDFYLKAAFADWSFNP